MDRWWALRTSGDGTEHPFIWSKSTGMIDLFLNGGLGGDFGHPDWVNDAGEVVRFSVIPDTASCPLEGHGFLWRDGVMTDLGTVDNDPTSLYWAVAKTPAPRNKARQQLLHEAP